MTTPNAVIVTKAGYAAFLAFSAGAVLQYTHIAFGDANGVSYTPNENQTGLVREVYRSPITAMAADAQGVLWFDTSIPADLNDGLGRPSHGWNVHEAGIFGTINGTPTLLAIAKLGGGYKASPDSGRAETAYVRLGLAGAPANAVALTVAQALGLAVDQMPRAPWLTVDGITNAVPENPAAGATHIVGTAPNSTFAGHSNKLAQWTGTAWVFAACPIGHVVVDNTRGEGDALRYLRRTAAGWVSAMASTTVVGPTRLATPAEVLAAAAGVAMSPDQLGAWVSSRTFPPNAHTHPISEVTSLQAALDGKVAKAGDTMTGALTAPTVTVTGTLTGATIMQSSKQVLDHSTDPRAASGSYLTGGSKDAGGIAVDVAGLFPAGRRIAAGSIDHAAVAAGYTWPIAGGTITAAAFGANACTMDVAFSTPQPDLQYSVLGIAVVNGVPNVNITLSNKTTAGCKINFPPPYAAIESLAALFELYR